MGQLGRDIGSGCKGISRISIEWFYRSRKAIYAESSLQGCCRQSTGPALTLDLTLQLRTG